MQPNSGLTSKYIIQHFPLLRIIFFTAMTEEEQIRSNIIYLNNSFCGNALYSLEGKSNIIVSPPILYKFLSLLSQDKTYISRSNFKLALRMLDNDDFYFKCYKDFISSLLSFSNETFSLSSRLYFNDDYKLQDDFKNTLNNFHYETEAINFSRERSSAEIVDSWIKKKTNGLITDLVTNDSLTNKTPLCMVNTIHFKEKWDGRLTIESSPGIFHLNENDTIQTEMMKMTHKVYYNFDEYMSIATIELPFSSSKFSLILLLPDKQSNSGNETDWWQYLPHCISDMRKELVEISLPKFKIEQLLDCRDVLPNIGLAEEFKDDIHFFDMLQSGDFLKFSQIDKKGTIVIDEEGVEAASGLAVTMAPVNLGEEVISPDGLKMLEMTVNTTISNRFAKTLVKCTVQNNNTSAQEAVFTVVLPETAFITEFVMEMDGESYKSYIKEVQEAKTIYNEAVAEGKSAGIVEADTRDSTQFKVSVNLEQQSVAVFLLTYEEMLQRIHDQYELVLNINPGRLVDNLNVEVNINESRPLKFVKTPSLRSGNEVNPKMEPYLVPSSDIKIINSNTSIVKFKLDVEQQRKFSTYLGIPIAQGFAGQFVVQYDVERDRKDGEVLLQDGYFVHFFAPNDLDPLPKHVVFVLDTSTSMTGRKINQLKDAMMSILDDIKKGDLISILEFNTNVVVWDIHSEKSKTISCGAFKNFAEPFEMLDKFSLPNPILVDDVTINKAKNVVQKMPAQGSTFMIGGLEMALYMIKVGQDKIIDKSLKYQPIMIFLTDGQPNIGYSSPPQIVQTVTQLNLKHNNVPIFSLSFGEGADKSFLRELSLKNFGFSRHIYEASDASLQLQSFYKQISSPLLTDIKFKYKSNVTEVTRSHFPIYFRGGELVVAGRCTGCQLPNAINGCGPRGYLNLASVIENPVTSLERLWAYLTVKQLLEERNTVDNKEKLTKRAIDLALKYSFVTEVTSLVVVKPNETCDTGVVSDDDVTDSIEMEDYTAQTKKKVIRKRVIKKSKRCDSGQLIEELPEDIVVVEEVEPKKPKKLKFIADHPFLVAVALKKGDKRIFIFMGRVHKPSH